MAQSAHAWALILAAGEGSRLQSLTSDASGAAVPKQYCTLRGGPTLLETTIRRARKLAPLQRISIIVAQQHRRWWQRDLRELPAGNVVVQPRNRGTAHGILLQLLHVQQRDPQAQVILLPSDHFVADEPTLTGALQAAFVHQQAAPQSIVLLGMQPSRADPHLGYIVPVTADVRGALPVAEFVEKPTCAMARRLIGAGALWNAFMVVAGCDLLLQVFEQRIPEAFNAMRAALADPLDPAGHLAALYDRLPTVDFSRDVMGDGSALPLRVLPVPECGWSDLGTPERVAETLAGMPADQRAPAQLMQPGTPVNLASNFQQLADAPWPVERAAANS